MDDHGWEWGQTVHPAGLTIASAKRLRQAAETRPGCRFIEARSRDGAEAVVVDLEVAVPPRPLVRIQNPERVLVGYPQAHEEAPFAVPLRPDFPQADLPHMNYAAPGEPRPLCLFQDYQDERPRLTPERLLDRVAHWLKRAAQGKLHGPEQSLEPLLHTREPLYCKRSLLESAAEAGTPVPCSRGEKRLLLLPLNGVPSHSQVISRTPRTLADLWVLAKGHVPGADAALRRVLKQPDKVLEDVVSHRSDLQELADWHDPSTWHLAVLLRLPKRREKDGPVEATEWWAFCLENDLANLAAADETALHATKVKAMRPTFELDSDLARRLSGIPTDERLPRTAVVGLGALGSQIALDLARQGFKDWLLIDHDLLLPHNLARHAVSGLTASVATDRTKVGAVDLEIRCLLGVDCSVTTELVDVVEKLSERDWAKQLKDYDLLLDCSASHAVATALACFDSLPPCIKFFLGPGAGALFALAEDGARRVRLHDLEQQLAAIVATREELARAGGGQAGRIMYSGSCADTSTQMATELVSLHAGIAAAFVKRRRPNDQASLWAWTWSPERLAVEPWSVAVEPWMPSRQGEWRIRVSPVAVLEMERQRQERLQRHPPVETGGVLLGQFDVVRHLVHVAAALPSPRDSDEWPNGYIRGVVGLAEDVQEAARRSQGELEYVGEWHSHCGSPTPSHLDREAHERICEAMGGDGLPGLVLIKGDSHDPTVMLEPAQARRDRERRHR